MRTKKVIVCANCLRASCWHSIFICEKYRSAGIADNLNPLKDAIVAQKAQAFDKTTEL